MATSIKFDGMELANLTYIPRWLMHESAPSRSVSAGGRTDGDGSVFVSARYEEKRITVKGTLTAADKEALDAAIDSFKELLGREQKILSVSFASGTREYVATCVEHEFDRDHCDFQAVDWSATFVVPSGEGKDTAATLALNEHVVTVTTPGTDSFTIAGSRPPLPVITLKGAYFHALTKGIEYRDTDTGERIVITRNAAWANEDQVIIDCEARTAKSTVPSLAAATSGNFYGTFPRFKVGTNNVRITAGDIVNQTSPDTSPSQLGSSTTLKLTTKYKAQSFTVPYGDDTFQGITVMLAKVGTPGSVTLRIETDAGDKPSGTYADIAHTSEATILAASVGASPAYVTGWAAAPFTLRPNVKYWLVMRFAGVSSSNYYELNYIDVNAGIGSYLKGTAKYSDDSGSTWALYPYALTWPFRILFGGRASSSSVKHTVSYKKTYL